MMRSADAYVIEPLVLYDHWAGINRLLEIEEWPFVRADFEVSETQPRAVAFVARAGEEILGFFTAHHFDDVAYLDMVVIRADRRRDVLLAHDLWQATRRAMHAQGFTGFVAHCTRTTAPVVRLLGYAPGLVFSLMRKGEAPERAAQPLERLGPAALGALVDLDAQVFGTRREHWLRTLLNQTSTRFHGRFEGDRLVASVCVRTRRENALCLDACNAIDIDALDALLTDVWAAYPDKRLECFVRHGSDLQPLLEGHGFEVPAFFREIGPLVEYRLGAAGELGLGPHTRTLSWI
jgi:hypothetical protein